MKLSQRYVFQRQVFLITRGNSYTLFRDIEGTEDAFTFMVMYLGEKFGNKLRKLCEFMDIEIYLTDDEETQVEIGKLIITREIESERLEPVILQTKNNLVLKMRRVALELKK